MEALQWLYPLRSPEKRLTGEGQDNLKQLFLGITVSMIVRTVTCKLRTNEQTAAILADTMEQFNLACNWVSWQAWATGQFRAYDLHHIAYQDIRKQFQLTSRLATRAIGKVADSYKEDRSQEHVFGPQGAVIYDPRSYKLIGVSSVSLSTLHGRLKFSLAHGGKQREQLAAGIAGEADLLFRDGNYYLAISVKTPDPPVIETKGVIGIDLGITRIATDSEGQSFTGAQIMECRRLSKEHRRQLHKTCTRSAFKRLQKQSRRQSRYVRDVNHCISKQLVEKALTCRKALAIETLKGITKRVHGSRQMRWLLGNWAFAQLGSFISYKAQSVGLPVIEVDPAYTSQTCSKCGHCERSNRKSQSKFECLKCGFVANADENAAVNIGARAEMSDRLLFQPS